MAPINVSALIAGAAEKLDAVGIDDGAAEAELVLCELLDVDRLHMYLHGPTLIDDDIVRQFDAVIDKRLTRRPLQYILGSAWFYGRKFIVNENVMIPTPETELLLDTSLRAVRFCRSNPVRLLDIGTGSGVIALSAKLENPALDVTAVDISPKALDVARENAERFEVADDIRFVESDLLEALDRSHQFDIIACNPPYIRTAEYEGLEPEVKAEPQLALLAGPKGLDVIERLITQAPDRMTHPGFLLFEIGYNQADDVLSLVRDDGRYPECIIMKDLDDRDRVALCKVGP